MPADLVHLVSTSGLSLEASVYAGFFLGSLGVEGECGGAVGGRVVVWFNPLGRVVEVWVPFLGRVRRSRSSSLSTVTSRG